VFVLYFLVVFCWVVDYCEFIILYEVVYFIFLFLLREYNYCLYFATFVMVRLFVDTLCFISVISFHSFLFFLLFMLYLFSWEILMIVLLSHVHGIVLLYPDYLLQFLLLSQVFVSSFFVCNANCILSLDLVVVFVLV
jgi:hypothetical protein